MLALARSQAAKTTTVHASWLIELAMSTAFAKSASILKVKNKKKTL